MKTKLVRDRIPEIILNSGRTPLFYIANCQEYKELLRQKLFEEVAEFLENESMEEIADILEVLEALSRVNEYTLKEVLKIKRKKKLRNGSFDQRIILKKIIMR
jgi:predicted house-cleaning noncanonical NTP pyrophosphatase (MazG superfamily)